MQRQRHQPQGRKGTHGNGDPEQDHVGSPDRVPDSRCRKCCADRHDADIRANQLGDERNAKECGNEGTETH